MIYVDNDFILDEIAKSTGLAPSVIKKVVIAQRRAIQQQLSEGYAVRLMGLVDILPEPVSNRVNLIAKVNPTIKRPKAVRLEEPTIAEPIVVDDPDVE